MPESPKLNDNPDFMRWVLSVNQQEPMCADAELACKIIREYAGYTHRTLRAFWHESFGHWWVHPTGDPGHQVGSVMQAEVDRVRAAHAA